MHWVDVESLHVTLKFLGDTKVSKLEQVYTHIEKALEGTPPIHSQLTTIGAFPRIAHPKVICIGCQDTYKHMFYLAQRIDDEIGNIGFKEQRRGFKPHVTLGRTSSFKNISPFASALTKTEIQDYVSFAFSEVVLYKTQRTEGGVKHDVLKKFTFPKAS
ncbi:MAG: 2'-5' RNA ligase [Candidatus Omnitrophota bacterium]